MEKCKPILCEDLLNQRREKGRVMAKFTLRALREINDLKIEEVAKHCNLTVSELQKVEEDSSEITVGLMRKFYDLYQVPFAAIK